MDQRRLENHNAGFTESRKGNRFSFESPAPGIHIYSNVWPEAMEFFDKLDTPGYWKDSKDVEWVREDYLDSVRGKRSKTCWVWNDEMVAEGLSEVIDSYLLHWDLDPQSRESLRISKFAPTGEFFGVHSDDTFATPRTTSMVYYPNDDYEGGELEFIHFGIKIKPKANQLFLFPAAYSYEHRILPVTGGNPRMTIVSFFNQMTEDEKQKRLSMLDPNKYYQSDLQYVFSEEFSRPSSN